MKSITKVARIATLLLGLVLALTSSANGKWVKLTKDFDKSIPFEKIKVGLPLNFHENAKIYFSKTPNDTTDNTSYYYDTYDDYLYEDGHITKWNDLELGSSLGSTLHTFSTPMFFKGADKHASIGTIKVWEDDSLIASYKKQQEELVAQAQAKAQAEKEQLQNQYIGASAMQWLNDTYNHVFQEEAQTEGEVTDESQFFTADYNRVLNACSKAEEKTGDVLGLDMSHWTMSQDPGDPSQTTVSFLNADVVDSTHVTTVVEITYPYGSSLVKVKLAKENDQWKIDDFIFMKDGSEYSEKEAIINALKEYKMEYLLK